LLRRVREKLWEIRPRRGRLPDHAEGGCRTVRVRARYATIARDTPRCAPETDSSHGQSPLRSARFCSLAYKRRAVCRSVSGPVASRTRQRKPTTVAKPACRSANIEKDALVLAPNRNCTAKASAGMDVAPLPHRPMPDRPVTSRASFDHELLNGIATRQGMLATLGAIVPTIGPTGATGNSRYPCSQA
jgi:hypothetical protein